MIQILALREFFSQKQKRVIKSEVWFDRGYRATSVEDLFLRAEELVAALPESDRWNVYYTVSDCVETSGRILDEQFHYPFDVDGIKVPEEGLERDQHLAMLARLVCSAIGVPFEKVGVVFSGNGLQFIVGSTREPIKEVPFFDLMRPQYGAICDRIDQKLRQAGIDGKADRSVWSPARLMRMPLTLNRKPGKPERWSTILQRTIERVDFDLETASGLKTPTATDAIPNSVVGQFPTPDTATIMKECEFLKWGQTHPEKLSEPEWYAALSITAKFPEGRKFSHKFSEGHPGYNFHETESKIDQALTHGPRTCANIDAISGGKCKECKHFKTSLVSPIMIQGPNHIATEATGFRFVKNKDGKISIGKPDITGLRNYFVRERKAVVIENLGSIWTWEGRYYQNMKKMELQRFAQSKIQPEPSIKEKAEFFDSVQKMSNVKSEDFFLKTIQGKLNFQNGVLDIKTRHFMPHSPDLGFRSEIHCEYDRDGKAPRFMQFLDEITCSRQELKNILQEFLGYTLANESCRFETGLLLIGDGSNGKSVFLNVVRALTGEDGHCSLPVKDFGNEQACAILEGKMACLSSENGESSFQNADVVKTMISGEPMRLKRPYESTYEFKNRAKLIMSCNKLPKLNDHSFGFFRRFQIMPFDRIFTAEDKDVDLSEKLARELPGIVNWAMEGYERLIAQNGFTPSPIGQEMLNDYRIEMSPLTQFFQEMCIVDQHDSTMTITMQEAYESFGNWLELSGYRRNIPRIQFQNFMRDVLAKKLKYTPEERRSGPNRLNSFTHLKLRSIPGGVKV